MFFRPRVIGVKSARFRPACSAVLVLASVAEDIAPHDVGGSILWIG